ncbi:MAG: type II CAAX endopeptidase family protein [Longimicrobiales bacterium]
MGAGWLIALVGVAPWAVLGTINARLRPDIPWAAAGTTVSLVLLLAWLNGFGWPERTKEARRSLLRLRMPSADAWSREQRSGTLALMAGIAGMAVLWILVSGGQRITDLSPYPTPAYRVSVLVMGAVVSGVVEEAAFRGYTQSMLEPWGRDRAIVLASVAFVLLHITHGPMALLLMGPGYFAVSYLYGLLAWRTGSIIPGIVLHVAGDFLHTVFALLGGDLGQLFR